MAGTLLKLEIIAASSLAPLTVVTLPTASAAECGWGTVYDAPTNSCVAAPPPPAPPPPPPAWNGDLTPGFGVGVCVPIPVPFAPSVCGGV
jgi:hypothetical protein